MKQKRQRQQQSPQAQAAAVNARISSNGSLFSNIFPSSSDMPPLLKFSSFNLNLSHYVGNQIPKSINQSIFESMRSLRPFYESSRMSWDDMEKQSELTHHSHHIITATQTTTSSSTSSTTQGSNLIAFVCFRFDVEEDIPEAITYVYEVFVHQQYRGRGIAVALMHMIERISMAYQIRIILLTVFENNIPALNMYKKRLSYKNDASCPTKWDIHDAGYQILRKDLNLQVQHIH